MLLSADAKTNFCFVSLYKEPREKIIILLIYKLRDLKRIQQTFISKLCCKTKIQFLFYKQHLINAHGNQPNQSNLLLNQLFLTGFGECFLVAM